MNFKSIGIVLLILLKLSYSSAQITSTEIKPIEKPIEKTKSYDGVSDFQIQERYIDYKQYIGLKIYVPANYTYGFFEGNSGFPVKGPVYFTIKDVIFGKESEEVINRTRFGSTYTIIARNGGPLLVLQEEGNDKIYYFYFEDYMDDFVLVNYFLKQKELHDNKKYVIVSYDNEFQDYSSFEMIKCGGLYGGVWTCEVNMVKETVDDYSRTGAKREIQKMQYIFRDTSGHIISRNARKNSEEAIQKNSIFFVTKLNNNKFYNSYFDNKHNLVFMLKEDYSSEYKKIEEKKNKDLAKDKINSLKNNVKNAEAKKKWLQAIKVKYGVENANLISQGKIKLGMNSEMCAIAWGGLYYEIISRIQDSSGTHEIWKHQVYGTNLYFKNNKLYKIVN